jgi:hypothetical protein
MRKTFAFGFVALVLAWITFNAYAKGGPKDAGKSASAPVSHSTAAAEHGKDKAKAPEQEKTAKRIGRETQIKGEKAEQAKAKGKNHAQQLEAMRKQTEHEQAKHLERQARLQRIRQLAQQKGNDKLVAKVDELMAKENARYERKMRRLSEKAADRQQRAEKAAPQPDKEKTKAGDEKAKTQEDNPKDTE